MSGICIHGMEMPTMPKTLNQGDSIPYIDVRIFADGSAVVSKGEKPYYTEYSAVPVPEHGRLIDAVAFIEQLDDSLPAAIQCLITYRISKMPTIIPASEEKAL